MEHIHSCEIDSCNRIANISVDGHIFCMQHYEDYYNNQEKAQLDFEFINRKG